MGIKKSKVILKIIGMALEILGALGAIIVPTIATVILPIGKALEYYGNNGEGIGMVLKTILIVFCLSPLLGAAIFIVLFIPGAVLFDLSSKEYNDPNQIIGIVPNGEQRNPMDDFVIVKEDNPSRSDAGIAEMNWRLKHQKEKNNE